MLIFFSGISLSLFWLVCHCLYSISFIVVQVCPTIILSLIIRVLCNFTPDEFCPDPVPGTVLEALNAEVCLTYITFIFKLFRRIHQFVARFNSLEEFKSWSKRKN